MWGVPSTLDHPIALMSHSSLPWLIVGTVVVAAGLAWFTLNRGGIVAPGAATPSEHYPLAPFHDVEIGGAADVILVQGGAEAIDVEAGARTVVQGGAEAIDVEAGTRTVVEASVNDGRLVIRAHDRRRWWSRLFGGQSIVSPSITVHLRTLDKLALTGNVRVSIPKLEAKALRIAASGGASLTIDDLQARSLRVDGSGALKADLAGRVDDEHVSISGAVNYRAERLRATNATVSVSGVANVVVHAERKLRASISGAGLIEYVGDPEVIEHVSGMGRVKRRDSSVMPGMRVA
jgi:hypothetical protein